MTNHHQYGHKCEVCAPQRGLNSPLTGPLLGRRSFFKLTGAGIGGYFLAPTLTTQVMAAPTVDLHLKNTARNCIFILLTGAPSGSDTFDLKVGSWTPSDFNPTTYNGVLFPQGLMPKLAEMLTTRLGIVRNLVAPALVHPLQQTWAQIARSPSSALGKVAPNLGSVVALEFESQRKAHQVLPGFVSLNTGGSVVGAGYFDGQYTPFDVTAAPTGLGNLSNADGQTKFDVRYASLQSIDNSLRNNSPLGSDVTSMGSFYTNAKAMMYNTPVDEAFKFSTDDQTRYGSTGFGNSCVVARNLLKADLGTRFIQINYGSWDHHDDIYDKTDPTRLHGMAAGLDAGLANLITDLAAQPGTRGGSLLDETLIVAMGEFGRTVGSLTGQSGRDHFFQQFSVLAGGGIYGGRVIGETDTMGGAVKTPGWSQNRPTQYEDIATTIYSALGINYMTVRNDDPFGRGFEYVPFAAEGVWYPITELFATNRATTTSPTRNTSRRETGTRGNR